LKDLIFSGLEVQFEKEILLCLKNKSYYFEFPLQTEKLNIENKIECYDGLLKAHYQGFTNAFTWYKVIVSPCDWKGIEAYCLQFLPKSSTAISQFSNDYLELINNEFVKIVDLMENISVYATEPPKQKEAITPASIIPKSPNLIIRQTNNSKKIQQNAQCKLANYVGKNVPNIQLSTSEDSLDYSFVFLIKYQLNFVYDMYLSLLVFNSIKDNTLIKETYDFNITNFLHYIVNNFTLLSKMKRFKIEVKSQLESEIQGYYELIRVCVFNILLFIINNSNYEKEKHLEVHIKHDKFVGGGTMSYYKLYFKFSDQNPIIKYTQLIELFNKLKTNKINEIDVDILRLLDIGLITTFYIVNNIYNSELTIIPSKDSSTITIIVTFFAELKAKNASSTDVRPYNNNTTVQTNKNAKSIYPVKVFQKKTTNYVEDEAILKILGKVFKFKPQRDTDDETKHLDQKHNDLEDTDEEDQDEDYILENESVELDDKKYKEIKNYQIMRQQIKLSDYLLESKKICLSQIKSNQIMRKFKTTNEVQKTIKIKFDNADIVNNIKYCNPPRILIVEDNVYGRMNIRDNLKNIDIPLILDTAGDGKEAIEKFKGLFQQGLLFDIIFMDIYLPDILGNEATSIIREEEKKFKNIRTKIVAVTAEGKFEMDQTLFDNFCKILKKINFIL
jgi:CheY-like chemotaxis protein